MATECQFRKRDGLAISTLTLGTRLQLFRRDGLRGDRRSGRAGEGKNIRSLDVMVRAPFSVATIRICRKFRVRAITMAKKETSYGETEATSYFRRAA